MRSLSRLLPITLMALLCGCLCSCSSLTFFAANTPAAFGKYSRIANVSYAEQMQNKLDVYMPSTVANSSSASSGASTKLPVVIFVHGGGWYSGDKAQYKFVGVALAEQQYVAVLPDYRLYPQVKSPIMYEDLAKAVAYVHQHAAEWGGDVDRIYLIGHSAGAQIVMMVTLNQEYLRQVGGNSHWLRGVVGLAGPYDFLPFTFPYMNDLFGPSNRFAESQPVNYVRADAPPLLLMHGLQDHTVAPTNTRHLRDAMTAIGGNVQVEYFDNATHSDLIAAFSFVRNHKPPVIARINQFIATENATAPVGSGAVSSSQAGAR